ncbi:hydantoinase/oxoprolinase family protein [Streptomyces sp. WMMC940]|uniref:hydantoinase/oxoprolinase family protein n=1 Tax=Streptomyces sp. WMMC940 TaxID=3015153 RepID=UPI0022B5E689|nr:hydantoinase/oxoprolinase family protein [Streptomyces sp. WMMC940]MCZ7456119.1 hydantoinase/oxoprolinase family protein [Streptomyces sp. WMMC940]
MRIGIDVGGTNTDAVLTEGSQVRSTAKTSTTPDVTTGISRAIDMLRQQAQFDPASIQAVMIGTTHFVNALVEAKGLAPTAAIRFGLPATSGLPPLVAWPDRLVKAIAGRSYLCHGGHEFDGRTISPFDEAEVVAAVEDAVENGIRSIAISSVFSPVNAEFERQAEELIAGRFAGLHVSLSHEIGRMGLLERENATVINGCLRDVAEHVCTALGDALNRAGISAPLFLSQNDGTLMDIGFTRRYPVATFASGPTNSMRGAAYLSGADQCVVVDIGGTTTDVGMLQSGFPREAATEVEVAGVRTNFRMPDVLSIGIGGGSRVRRNGPVTVGPDSVGYQVTRQALVFGGDTLTATDIAVAAGRADIGDRSLVAHLDKTLVRTALEHIADGVQDVVDRMRTSPAPVPVVAVGGGSILVPDELAGASKVLRPEHFAVANAIGAAMAQIGGEVDRVFSVAPGTRDAVLDQARQEAVAKAVAAGADPSTVHIVDVDEVPLAYLPGNATRIRVKAVGDLAAIS